MTTLITPLPTPPTRQDSANFNDRADDFLGALPLFQQEANALAVDVQASADDIEIARQAVASVANVTKWVSGTTYAQGAAVWSLINGVTYRKMTTSIGGTTDPSLDTTNYKSITDAAGFTYIPTGVGSVTTTVENRLRESVSVLDFYANGVSGVKVDQTGSIDSTAGIQAAINHAALLGKGIYIPAGTYKITALTLPQQHGGIEIFGEAYNSTYNLDNEIYKGSVFVSTLTSGNVISSNGGTFYSNRGIRIRNLSIKTATTGYAIYINGSPECTTIENCTIFCSSPSSGNGVALINCWVGAKISNCIIANKTIAGFFSVGVLIANDIKAGGAIVENSSISGFYQNVYLGDQAYQITLKNVGMEGGTFGFLLDGANSSVSLETCHFEFNSDIAVSIIKSQSAVLQNCSFYRNGETASAIKAEVFISGGGSNYTGPTRVQDCQFFGVGTNVTGVYVASSDYVDSVVLDSNKFIGFGSSTSGINVIGSSNQKITVTNNTTSSISTPYTPSSNTGFKKFSKSDSGILQLRFHGTPVLSSDPNTLDDYEEGTWTPILGGDGGQTGQTYADQVGYYQKIGNRVYFTFSATLTAKGSVSLEAVLAGLPFPVAGITSAGAGYVSDFNNLGVSVVAITLHPSSNTSKFYFRCTTAAAASMGYQLGSNLFGNTTTIRGGGWYVTS